MASITTQIELIDRMSAPLHNIVSAVDDVIYSMQGVDNSIDRGFDSSVIDSARRSIDLANAELEDMQVRIRGNVHEQERFNDVVDSGSLSAGKLLAIFTELAGVVGVGFGIAEIGKSMYEGATQLEAVQAKFTTVFAGNTAEAQEFIDEVQELTPVVESEARSMASGMQDMLVPMGFARDVATDMTGEFFYLSGALTNFNSDSQDLKSVTDKFNGALTGEYDGLKDVGIQLNSTLVAQKAVEMGLASTTKEVSNQAKAQALLALAYEQSGDALAAYTAENSDTKTNAGLLFGDIFDSMAESGQKILPQINDLLTGVRNNMGTISTMIEIFSVGFSQAINIVSMLLTLVFAISNGVIENWSIISPILFGVLTILGLYLIATRGVALAHAIGTVIMGAFTTAQTFLSIGFGVLTGNTAAASAAVFTFNSALLASPITWIIMAVIALIAIFYAVIGVINKLTGTSISATGLIVGAFFWLGAMILNIVIGVINAVIQSLWTQFVEPWIGIVEWVLNVFNGGFDSFGDAVKNLLGQIISWFLSLGKVVTKIIDAIFGTDWTAGLNELQDNVLGWGKNENAITLDRNAPTIDHRFDATDAFDYGKGVGEGFEDTVTGLFSSDPYETAGYDDPAANVANNTNAMASDTSDIKDSVERSSEDLKYMREKADMEAINRFTTAEVKVEMGGVTNHVGANNDLDGMVDYLANTMNDALAKSAEGVHV